MHILIGLAVALALSGGVSFAANNAQEGDALYGFKTNVNDRIEATVEPISAEVRALFNADAEADVNADANASDSTYLTEDEGGVDSGSKMDTDFNVDADASVETNASSTLKVNL